MNRFLFRFFIVLIVGMIGCGQYPEVSPASYAYAKALYSATNQKSVERLNAVVDSIKNAHDAGDISADESKWLQAIADEAKNGNWAEANREARKLMEDQIKD